MKWSTILIVVAAFALCSVMSATPAFAKAGDLLFKYKLGEYGTGNPAIGSDGTIYACGSTFDWNIIGYNTTDEGLEYPIIETINGDYGLMAFLSNGTLKWKLPLPATAGSPAIDSEGTIYIPVYTKTVTNTTTTYNTSIYAVNPDGTVKWIYYTDPNIRIGGNFAIGTDNTIYFSAHDTYTGEPHLGELYESNCTLYALNPDGTVKWNYNTGKSISSASSPVIAADGTIYLGAWDVLHAFTPDGILKWTFTIDPGWENPWDGSIYPNDIQVTPSIDSDGTIYFGQRSFYFYAINPDGTLKWKLYTYEESIGYSSFKLSSPVIRFDGSVSCFGISGELLTLNPDGSFKDVNKSLKWEVLEGSIITGENYINVTPVIDSENTLYIGDFRHYGPSYSGDAIINADGFSGTSYISAVNPDGTIKWQYATETGIVGSPIISSDGVLLAVDYHGTLYAIETGTNIGYANTPWPMLGRNQFRTNNAGDNRVAKIGIRNTGDTAVKTSLTPDAFAIKGNYPNPFNPTTTIEFTLNKTEKTNLAIYNIAGQRVKDIIVDANLTPGVHNALWNGKDNSGKTVSSGVYFARLTAGTNTVVKTMMMVK